MANNCWIIEKQKKNSRKNIYFYFIEKSLFLQKAFECVDHNKLESSSRDGNTRPPHLPPEKSVSRSRSNSYNWIYNNRLVPNQERSMLRLYIVTVFNLYAQYIMRNTVLDEAQAGIKIPGRNINNSDVQITPPLWQKAKKN